MFQDVRHEVLLLQKLEHLEAGELVAVPVLLGPDEEDEKNKKRSRISK